MTPPIDTDVFAYDIRFNTVPVTEDNWDKCRSAGNVPKPAAPGTIQSFTSEMPDPGKAYYFGIKAIDKADNVSKLAVSQPAKSHPISLSSSVPGDLDCDEEITLSDAITALRIVSGIDPPPAFCKNDVNGDDKISLEEVIYILQKVAELR